MKYKRLLPLLLCSILLSGCWDKVEIDKKILISAIGIDVGKDISKQDELKSIKSDEPFAERRIKKLNITYGFPDISELGPGKSGTAKDKTLTAEAYSMEDALAQATLKSSRMPSYGHSRVLLISEDVLNYGDVTREIFDYLEREPTLNKMMIVMAVQGNAEEYIKFQPEMEKNVDEYITGLMHNARRTSSILPITLKEMVVALSENGNAILPRMSFDKDKKELVLSGVSVIKNYALKGTLTPLETGDLEILRGKLQSGKKVVYKKGHPVDFTIEHMNRKIKVSTKEDKLFVDISVLLEGSIKGYFFGEQITSSKNIADLEMDFNNSLSQELKEIVKITQGEMMVDPIGIREYVEKYKPSFWNKEKDKWDDTYKNAEINVNVDTHIRRVGVSK